MMEWQEICPDAWLLPTVTEETEGESRPGRLMAVEPDDVNLMLLWPGCDRQGKIAAWLDFLDPSRHNSDDLCLIMGVHHAVTQSFPSTAECRETVGRDSQYLGFYYCHAA